MPAIIFLAAISGLAFALGISFWIFSQPAGDETVKKLTAAIKTGAKAFLSRQYKTIGVVGGVVLAALWATLGAKAALGFGVGAVLSGLVGYLGMMVATTANGRVTQAASEGLEKALTVSVRGGAVTGVLVASLGLLSVALMWFFTQDPMALVALGFGGSLISVFARLGGGIYTKGADVGADLVGKVEAGIPEDDPRNPAVIADNVGDLVGDDAGMAADLFETYVITAGSAALLGHLLFPESPQLVLLPMVTGAVGLLATLVGILAIRARQGKIMRALYRGVLVSGVLSAAGLLFFTKTYLAGTPLGNPWRLYAAALVGFLVTAALFAITEYYTSAIFSPTRRLAESAQKGAGPTIIAGLALSMRSTAAPVVVLVAAILASFSLAGLYGVALAAVAMLSLAGMIVTVDAYGPITDNAGGIAQMAGLPEKVRKLTDQLDAVGNTTKAVTKAYAIGSAALAALVLFTAYSQELGSAQNLNFTIADPKVLVGLLLGAGTPFVFAAWALEAVGKAAEAVVEEVRRQFRQIKGLLEGKATPQYDKAVDLVTKVALSGMVLPSLLPVVAPLAVGFLLGPLALGGFLMGMIVSGFFLAISMTSGGAAWDNAKKFIEEGHFGGKGSESYKAAVIGDTVGDPYKDTAGPAINPAIKIANIVALLLAPFL